MKSKLHERLISESIEAVTESIDTSRLGIGEPGLPRRFVWRDREIVIDDVVRTWRETSPCSHGSGEMYARKQWYHVRTSDGVDMKIYFDRRGSLRSRKALKGRWWLYSVLEEASARET